MEKVKEEGVFCGPSVVFTNVYNPRALVDRKNEYKDTFVKKGATLGANCTILCGLTIGEFAFVGAGALVTMDTQIPPGSLVLGSPAKIVRALSNDEQKSLKKWAENYVQLSRKYLQKKIL